jgi:Concanavalin A-like lectin/glucanases superfamily
MDLPADWEYGERNSEGGTMKAMTRIGPGRHCTRFLRTVRVFIETALLATILGVLPAAERAEAQGGTPVRVVSLAPCQTSGQALEADLSTGLNISPGQQDPQWQITAAPPTQTGPFPAYGTNPLTAWVAPTPPALWIQRIQNSTPWGDSPGNYTYRLQVNLNLSLYSSVKIVGNYSADNSAYVQLNGTYQTACPGNSCFHSLHPLSINSGFVSGVNDLDIIVNNLNDGSPAGLLVEAKVQATCRACAWAPAGMVAWWPLDETSGTNVADRVGGFDGTAQPGSIGGAGPATSASGPPTFPFPAGKVATSLSFTGTQRVEVLTNPALEPGVGDFTIDAWVIYAAAGTGNVLTIVAKGSTSAPGYLLNIQDVSTTQGLLKFFVFGPSSAPILTANIAPQTWHHVAATLQRGTAQNMALYLDGALVGSGPVGSGGSVSNTLPLFIGDDVASKGEIAVDEVELFNRALSQPEIQGIFDAGSAGKCKCVSPPSGMVSWWPLDETGGTIVHDIVGSNNGTPKAGPVGSGGPTHASGMVAGALSFNGTSDFVQVPNGPNLNFGTGALSIDAWIKIPPRPGTNVMPIVEKEVIGFPNSSPYGYNFYVRNGHLGFSISSDFNITPHGSIHAEETTIDLADDLWHHVAVTVLLNPALGTLFIDGAPLPTPFSTTAFAGFTADNLGDLFIGSANALIRISSNAYFEGSIDEVEIFRRPLAPTEIHDIYRAGSAGKCKLACVSPPSGIVAWWTLDETPGSTVIHDIWSNHLDGTPVPSPVGPPGSGPNSLAGQYVNDSLYFAGGYVDVPDSPHLNFFALGGNGEFSIDAWLWNPGGTNGSHQFAAIYPVVDKTAVSGSYVTGYALYLYYPTFGGPPQLAFTLGDGTVAATAPPSLLSPYPSDRAWHFLTVTVARPSQSPLSAAVTLYVDGVSWSATTPVANTDNNADLWIAKGRLGSVLGANYVDEFAIDELEIFNRALTSQEVLGLYHAHSVGKCRQRGYSRVEPAPGPGISPKKIRP